MGGRFEGFIDYREDSSLAPAFLERLSLRENLVWSPYASLHAGFEPGFGGDAHGQHAEMPANFFASSMAADPNTTAALGTIFTPTISGNPSVDALLAGTAWTMSTINYAFATSPSDYPGGYGDGEPNKTFAMATVEFQQAVRYILEGHSSQSGGFSYVYGSAESFLLVDFQETAPADGIITIASSSDPGTAWGYYPWTDAEGGDVWFNNTYAGSRTVPYPQAGDYNWLTAIHELGHTLGLKHGHETDGLTGMAVPQFQDDLEYTVMSYRSYIGANVNGGYTNETWGFPTTYMMLDIAALQQMYGADYTTNSTDTIYTWNEDTGEMSLNGVGQGAPGGNRIFMTIWDGGGNDTYDFSNYQGGPVTVSLQPGGFSTASLAQLANLGNNNFARGNIFNALEFHGDTRSLIENAVGTVWGDVMQGNDGVNRLEGRDNTDNLDGLAGDDVIVGGHDDDVLNGGAGADTFVFNAGDGNDTILDFKAGGDHDLIQVIGYTNYTLSQFGSTTTVTFASGNTIALLDTAMASITAADFLFGNLFNGTANADTLNGTTDIDHINGLGGNDTLKGDAGNDFLDGGDGNDILEGGLGDDQLIGGLGVDKADYRNAGSAVTVNLSILTAQNTVGAGNDTLSGIEQVLGSAFNDTLTGDGGANTLDGKAGNDVLNGGAGGDILIGGVGADAMNGGGDLDYASYINATTGVGINLTTGVHTGEAAGDTFVNIERYRLSANNDTFVGSAATDYAYGAEGNDTLSGAGGIDRLYGQDGNDTLNGDAGNDILLGGAGADIFNGGADRDTASYEESTIGISINLSTGVHTGDALGDTFNSVEILWLTAFNDTFMGGAGDDEVRGAGGVDALNGGDGVDTLRGEDGNDVLNGDEGDDLLNGGAGADTLNGGNGIDTAVYLLATAGVTINLTTNVNGGEAAGDTYNSVEHFQLSNGFTLADSFTGGAGNDWVAGYKGVDTLNGMGGADTLNGGEHNDIINGGAGADKLIGGTGDDQLTGGTEADQFWMNAGLFGHDTITDFENGIDHIRITGQAGIDNISDLTITTNGSGWAVITLPDGSSITLTGITAGQVDASDFLWT